MHTDIKHGIKYTGIFKNLNIEFSLKDAVYSVIISIVIAGVFYYWFAAAERNYLFLYGHYGWRPFHRMTLGRYWMTGLVLSCFITFTYTAVNYILLYSAGFLKKSYRIPSWKAVWFLSQPVVLAGIPVILNLNSPVIPADIIIICVTVISSGLALGLYCADILLHSIKKFIILSLDGIMLLPSLILMLSLELPAKGVLNMTYTAAIVIALGGIAVSFSGLIINSYFFKRKKITPGKNHEIILFSFFYAYIILPMAHYLFAAPPGNPYITTSDNFFPDNNMLKLFTWILVSFITFIVYRLRNKILN